MYLDLKGNIGSCKVSRELQGAREPPGTMGTLGMMELVLFHSQMAARETLEQTHIRAKDEIVALCAIIFFKFLQFDKAYRRPLDVIFGINFSCFLLFSVAQVVKCCIQNLMKYSKKYKSNFLTIFFLVFAWTMFEHKHPTD